MGLIESRDQTPPLVIRGHHLFHYASLLRERKLSPPELATEDIAGIPNDRKFDAADGREGLGYLEDVFGTTHSQAKHFSDNTIRAYDDFMSLSDDHPVEIVAGKDKICDGCAIGLHCLDAQTSINEEEDVRTFVGGLKPGQRKRIESSPGFPRKISTTLGVVRRVLIDPLWDLPRRVPTS